jgi:glutamate-ammonia-ligase adenylyltransferase
MSAMIDAASAREEAIRTASRSLATFLDADERARVLLASEVYLPDDYAIPMRAARERGGLPEVRLEKRRRLLEIATRDLLGEIDLEEVGRRLSDLADACLQVTLEHIGAPEGFAVLAMGKLGARELNYCSDVDLMFVAEGDAREATKVAEAVRAALGESSPQGQPYRVDLNLRPEGRSGPLVRSTEAYLEYYRRWAKDWEHQALLKVRVSAGDMTVGRRLVTGVEPLVYAAEISSDRVIEVRRIKERVEGQAVVSARRARRDERTDVKLGPGGIRDIEFAVQLLQLVHGGADRSVRAPATLEALDALVEGGYIAEEDGAGLAVAYRWLRNVEHRLQLWREQQTHRLPTDPDDLARVARVLGFKDSPSMGAGARFERAHHAVLADVRGRFEKLFYRPMVEALSGAPGTRLSPEALRDRLRVLGFRDADRAARTLEGLVSGTSRRAKLFRILTPAFLRFLSATPQPDVGLFSFLHLGEALEGRLDALGSMRDNPPGLELLAKVLGSGRLLGEVLAHVPEELTTIAAWGGARPEEMKDRSRLVHEAEASLEWRGPERLLEGLRRFKRREMLRVAIADVAAEMDAAGVGLALTELAEACLEAALQEVSMPFAVIGLGKLGGRELGYASDLDVMFVFEGDPKEGERIAEESLRAIGEVTPEGQAFRIDADLRPEGRSGVIARSVKSSLEYYARWARPWEHLALVKARVAAGDRELGERFVSETKYYAYPERMSEEAIVEIRHLKVRMEKERIPRGSDPRRHLKLGPGGLSDIDFAVQFLQQQHGDRVEGLRTVSTFQALAAATAADLLTEQESRFLREAYLFLMRLRNRLLFMFGRPNDSLPVKPEELEALGIGMGLTAQPRQELEETYRRITRRARKVYERVMF